LTISSRKKLDILGIVEEGEGDRMVDEDFDAELQNLSDADRRKLEEAVIDVFSKLLSGKIEDALRDSSYAREYGVDEIAAGTREVIDDYEADFVVPSSRAYFQNLDIVCGVMGNPRHCHVCAPFMSAEGVITDLEMQLYIVLSDEGVSVDLRNVLVA